MSSDTKVISRVVELTNKTESDLLKNVTKFTPGFVAENRGKLGDVDSQMPGGATALNEKQIKERIKKEVRDLSNRVINDLESRVSSFKPGPGEEQGQEVVSEVLTRQVKEVGDRVIVGLKGKVKQFKPAVPVQFPAVESVVASPVVEVASGQVVEAESGLTVAAEGGGTINDVVVPESYRRAEQVVVADPSKKVKVNDRSVTPELSQEIPKETAWDRASMASLTGRVYDAIEKLKNLEKYPPGDRLLYIRRLEMADKLSTNEKKINLEEILEEVDYDLAHYGKASEESIETMNLDVAVVPKIKTDSPIEAALKVQASSEEHQAKIIAELERKAQEAKKNFNEIKEDFFRVYKDYIQKRHLRESLGFSTETKKWPVEYEEYKIEKKKYYQALTNQKRTELVLEVKSSLKGKEDEERKRIREELKRKINEFKTSKLFSDLEANERQDLLDVRAEALITKKKGVFSRFLSDYNKLPSWVRVGTGSAIATGALASFGALPASVIGTYFSARWARGLVAGIASKAVGKAVHAGGEKILGRFMGREEQVFKKEFNRKKLDDMVDNWEQRMDKMTSRERIRQLSVVGSSLLTGGLLAGVTKDFLPSVNQKLHMVAGKSNFMPSVDAISANKAGVFLESSGYNNGQYDFVKAIDKAIKEDSQIPPPDKLPDAYRVMRALVDEMNKHNMELSEKSNAAFQESLVNKTIDMLKKGELAFAQAKSLIDEVTVYNLSKDNVITPIKQTTDVLLQNQPVASGDSKVDIIKPKELLEYKYVQKGQGLMHTALRFGLPESEFKDAWKNTFIPVKGVNTHISDVGLVHTDTKVSYDAENRVFKVEGKGVGTDKDLYKAFQKEGRPIPEWLKDKVLSDKASVRQTIPTPMDRNATIVAFDEPRTAAAKVEFNRIVDGTITPEKAIEVGFDFEDGLSSSEEKVAGYLKEHQRLPENNIRQILNIQRAVEIKGSRILISDIDKYYSAAINYSAGSAYDQVRFIEFIKGDKEALYDIFDYGKGKILNTNTFESIKQVRHDGSVDVEIKVRNNAVPMHIMVDYTTGQFKLKSGGFLMFGWSFDSKFTRPHDLDKEQLEKALKHMLEKAKGL